MRSEKRTKNIGKPSVDADADTDTDEDSEEGVTQADIQGVLFDLDDTLFDSSKSSRISSEKAVKAMIKAGLPARSFSACFRKLETIRKKYGSNYDKHYDRLCEQYGVSGVDAARIVATGIVAYHESKSKNLKAFPYARTCLSKLRRKGIKIGIVTNGLAKKQYEKLIRMKLLDFAETVQISGYADASKSKASLAKSALKQMNLRPQQAIWVGDKIYADIECATKIGVIPVLSIQSEKWKCRNIPQIKGIHVIRDIRSLFRIIFSKN